MSHSSDGVIMKTYPGYRTPPRPTKPSGLDRSGNPVPKPPKFPPMRKSGASDWEVKATWFPTAYSVSIVLAIMLPILIKLWVYYHG